MNISIYNLSDLPVFLNYSTGTWRLLKPRERTAELTESLITSRIKELAARKLISLEPVKEAKKVPRRGLFPSYRRLAR